MKFGFRRKAVNEARYIIKSESDHWSIELSFNGGSEVGKGNPSNTDVKIRLLSKVNQQWLSSPWQLEWERSLGNIEMPTGAWNGIYLAEIVNNLFFFAFSNSVICICPETGKELWKVCTGNTPIYKIFPTENNDSIIVYNGYYGFERIDGKGNIIKLNLEGETAWRVELPSEKDIYANPPYYKDGDLYSNSWDCFQCKISEEDGTIIDKQFTK